MSDRLRILIAGAGVGGLALAQALRHSEMDVAVYEQDPTSKTRNQGYRIHIDANGNAALRTCLPREVLAIVRRSSGINNDLVATYTDQLQPIMTQSFPDIPEEEITHVDRNAFRHALLTGLGDTVQFGRTVLRYALANSGRVRVEFAGGGGDEGDLLVGADGVGSPVRRQLLPHAVVRDLGLRCIYGRMPITEVTDALIPDAFNRGFCWVAGENGWGAAFAPMRFRCRPESASNYLMTALVATSERLSIPDEKLFKLSTRELWQIAADATAGWHPSIRSLCAHADADSFFPITIRAAERVQPWESGPVTLLGDAIHTMPPTGGVGANTALQDAATLACELAAAQRGEQSLIEAVGAYERVMLPRGVDTVDSSLRMADQLFARSA